MDWAKKWLFDFNAGKTQLVSFDQSDSSNVNEIIRAVLNSFL